MNIEKCQHALMSLSEEFRTKTPPDLKSSMQCLLAILNLPVPNHVMAKTNFHIGLFIYKYTTDVNIAQSYFLRAFEQSQHPELASLRLQIIGLLVEVYLLQNQRQSAKQILARAINDTSSNNGGPHNIYWHYRFLLKLAHLNLEDKEFSNAINLLSSGLSTATATNDPYTKMLFLLSKSMILMIARKYPNSLMLPNQSQQINPDEQLSEHLARSGEMLQSWPQGMPKKQVVEMFFLTLQVCYYLNRGQNKTAKPYLKFLQQNFQNLSNSHEPDDTILEAKHISQNMTDNLIWMPKDHMRILVYLISVLHNMQNGSVEKAQKFSHLALIQIENLRKPKLDDLLSSFQILLYEHMSMFQLVMGNRTAAIRDTVQAIQLCYKSSPQIKISHRGNIRSLLGLYAMSMSLCAEAEEHFKSVMNDMNVGSETRFMSMLNLALCYLQNDTQRESSRHDLEILLTRIDQEQSVSLSLCLKASAFYVLGLKAFCDQRYDEAKRKIKEALDFTSKEDLERLTSCSLILLGKVFCTTGRPNETNNVLSAGFNLFKKLGDVPGQLWAAAVFKELYSRDTSSQQYVEFSRLQEILTNSLEQDRMQASSSQEHNYVRWADWH